MKVLVVGSGGREDALVWKISQSPLVSEIYVAPGNSGIMCHDKTAIVTIPADNINALIKFAKEKSIDLTVVGPEDPLAHGIVDRFEKEGLNIFGPNQFASQLEASKIFSKHFMLCYNVPTPLASLCLNELPNFGLLEKMSYPRAIKADGLSKGKGVIIVHDQHEAKELIEEMISGKKFGKAGQNLLAEEFMTGEEISILAFTDGKTIKPLIFSQDHKPVFENDEGPNTGGMGAYAPALKFDKYAVTIQDEIINRTLRGLKDANIDYKGVLYFGIIMTKKGPFVLEYNVRFGDPELQAIIPLLKTDLVEVMLAVVEERLDEIELEWEERFATCVVMASGGYPGSYIKGLPITGLEKVEAMDDVIVFHAGTKYEDDNWYTNGGRIVGVTGLGNTIESSIKKAYAGVNQIYWDDMHFRTDIGAKALRPFTV